MSEINAAFGLLQLKHIDEALARRAHIDAIYRERLHDVRGIRCVPKAGEKVSNHAHFPILVGPDYPISRDALYQKFRDENIYARRYFYPLISDFPIYRGLPSAHPDNLPVARAASQQILCLPIFPALTDDMLDHIIGIIADS
jgi:dTDP-4-amino-4,6-dideoxygalactose transaminase